MRRKLGYLAFVAALGQVACGDDPTAFSPVTAGSSAVTAGRSGEAGSAEVATAGRSGSTPIAEPDRPLPQLSTVVCGNRNCPVPANVASELLRSLIGVNTVPDTVACCLDAATSTCGSAASANAVCEGPAVPEPSCPGIDLSALYTLVGDPVGKRGHDDTGCCTQQACGIDGVIFGRGCVENDEMGKLLNSVPVIGPLLAAPPASRCVPVPRDTTPADSDAGI